MEFRSVNTPNLTFKYPVTWEKEKKQILIIILIV